MKRKSLRITFVITAFTAAIAVVIGAFAHAAAGRKLREAVLAELQPVALKNCTLKRFGSANDGGYLMCESLIEPPDAAYSYGVGINDDWGCEVARREQGPGDEYDWFDPANLHFNNWSCTSKVARWLAWASRVLWVKTRIGVIAQAAPVPAPMSPLTAPASPTWPDCQLPAPRSQP